MSVFTFRERLCNWLRYIEIIQPEPTSDVLIQQWLKCSKRVANSDSVAISDTENAVIERILRVYTTHFKKCIQIDSTIATTNNLDDITSTRSLISGLIARHQVEQRTEKWYEETVNILTASELGHLFSGKRLRERLILSKTVHPLTQSKRTQLLAVQTNSMSAFDWGIRFEPVVKQIYCYKYKTILKDLGRIYDKVDPKYAASPDGLVYDDTTPNKSRLGRLIEIKCPVTREEDDDGIIPKGYYLQMQMQLHVSGCMTCDYIEARFSSPYSREILNRVGPCKYNGKIALIMNSKYIHRYEYSNVNAENLCYWVPNVSDDDTLIEIIPWGLFSWKEVDVVAKNKWWTLIGPFLDTFWNDVRRVKDGTLIIDHAKKCENGAISDDGNSKCLIRLTEG